jgi:hypothetical protein
MKIDKYEIKFYTLIVLLALVTLGLLILAWMIHPIIWLFSIMCFLAGILADS